MNNRTLQYAAISGALAVIIGAFGAHALKPHLSDYQIDIYEKGVQYQFVHTLAMLFAGLLPLASGRFALWAQRFFLAGIVCFSGSLYLLACRELLPFPVAWVGPVTPLGGLAFIGGWISLLIGFRKSKQA
ncbi:MAG: DUF423 domain-containing protein [Saprospiraceae bacterium]|nr:DUF423 domain-containing protein [Saprospiraceae bacterium]